MFCILLLINIWPISLNRIMTIINVILLLLFFHGLWYELHLTCECSNLTSNSLTRLTPNTSANKSLTVSGFSKNLELKTSSSLEVSKKLARVVSWWAPTTNFQEFPQLLTSFPSERYLQAEEPQPHRSHCSSAEKNTTKVHPRFWRCLRSSCSGYGPWKSWYVLEFMPRENWYSDTYMIWWSSSFILCKNMKAIVKYGLYIFMKQDLYIGEFKQ